MIANLRCKENFQGDRCRKSKLHHFATNPERDEVHAGNFTAWTGEGDSKTVVAVAAGSRTRLRRSRSLNRFMRSFTTKKFDPNLVPNSERKSFKYLLDMARKHYGGIQKPERP